MCRALALVVTKCAASSGYSAISAPASASSPAETALSETQARMAAGANATASRVLRASNSTKSAACPGATPARGRRLSQQSLMFDKWPRPAAAQYSNIMEKIWLNHYPAGIPAEVNVHEYASLLEIFDRTCAR